MEARIKFVRDGKIPVLMPLPMTTSGAPILPSKGDRISFDFQQYFVNDILWDYDGIHTVTVTAGERDNREGQ